MKIKRLKNFPMAETSRKSLLWVAIIGTVFLLAGYGIVRFGLRDGQLFERNPLLTWEAQSQLKRVKREYADVAEWLHAYAVRNNKVAEDEELPAQFRDRMKEDELEVSRVIYVQKGGGISCALWFCKENPDQGDQQHYAPSEYMISFEEKKGIWDIFY